MPFARALPVVDEDEDYDGMIIDQEDSVIMQQLDQATSSLKTLVLSHQLPAHVTLVIDTSGSMRKRDAQQEGRGGCLMRLEAVMGCVKCFLGQQVCL